MGDLRSHQQVDIFLLERRKVSVSSLETEQESSERDVNSAELVVYWNGDQVLVMASNGARVMEQK